MILTGPAIVEEFQRGRIVIDPFDKDKVGPNSYDLTLGDKLLVYKREFVDPKIENPVEERKIPADGIIVLPGTLYLGFTNEIAGANGLVPCLEGKSSLARLGISVHQTAGFGDDGFVGQWTLEITVTHSARLYAGMKIAQIYFYTTFGVRKPYSGKYNGSQGVVASRSHLDFNK